MHRYTIVRTQYGFDHIPMAHFARMVDAAHYADRLNQHRDRAALAVLVYFAVAVTL